MKIDTTIALKGLDGSIIKNEDKSDFTIGKAISSILLQPSERKTDVAKLFILAQKFYSDDQVELDSADFGLVKDIVKTSQAFSPLVSGQIAVYLESLK